MARLHARVVRAGFVDQGLIASNNAIVNAFAFYVLGRRHGVRKPVLDEFISRWVFATLLSARYSSSSETTFEEDLSRVRDLDPADAPSFTRTLDDALSETTTGDYWSHAVVAALQTQRRRAPAALAFRAAQVVLGARGLFSDQLLQNLVAPPSEGKRSASEAHHLFPLAWLARAGITDRKIVNQVANYADLGYFENSTIGAQSPEEYVPRLRDELDLDDERWGRMCAEHALPPNWESMDYNAFLGERRERMAELTHVAFRKLGGESEAVPLTPPWFLPGLRWVRRRAGLRGRHGALSSNVTCTATFGLGAPVPTPAPSPGGPRVVDHHPNPLDLNAAGLGDAIRYARGSWR